ncbi:MAG: hypothetical protein WAO76_17705 [Georgfuchsia sp.]
MSTASSPLRTSATAALLLLAAIYWLMCHRYSGIWHDAVIYNLMAAQRLNPAAYAHDLFFAFGSQGSYSLFTPLFAGLTDLFGIDLANRLVVLGGAALWVCALTLLARGMQSHAIPIFVAVLANVVLQTSYSLNGGTFVLNENFATARSLAFPIALFAIALDNAGRSGMGAVSAMVATAIHPLLGIWSVLVAVSRRLSDRRLIVIGAVLLVLLALAALFSVTPAFQIMDAVWEARVRQTAPDVFAGGWEQLATDRILFWIAACWAGSRFGATRNRRLYLVVAMLSAWAVLLSQLCSYWLPLSLIMQLQPWRVLWLAVVLGVFALTDSAWQLFVTHKLGRYWLLLAAVLLFSLRAQCGAILLGLLVLDAAGFFSLPGKSGFVQHKLVRYLPLAMVAILLPGCLLMLQMDGLAIGNPWLVEYPLIKGLAFGGGGLLFAFWAWLATRRWGAQFIVVCTVPLLIIALLFWDARSPQRLAMESSFLPGGNPDHVFRSYLHTGDIVAGVDRAAYIWFALGATGYVSAEQATGIVFSREKMLESVRRLRRLAIAGELREGGTEQEAWRRLLSAQASGIETSSITGYDKSNITSAGIAYLCADPLLGWVVTSAPLPEAFGAQAVASDVVYGKTNYLYDCHQLRATNKI